MATKSMDLGQVMGTSAYQEAQAGGYTGTKEEFQKELAAVGNGGETFVIQANANVSTSGITISNVDKTLDEVNTAREAGKAIRLKLIRGSEAYQEFPLLGFVQVSEKFIYGFGGADALNAGTVQLTFEGDSVSAVAVDKKFFSLSDNSPAAPGTASAGTSDAAARADHVHPKEVSDTDRATWNSSVRYDAPQSLTDAQKTQARGNIDAAPGGFGLGGVLVDAPENSEGFADANLITATGFYRAVRNVLYGGWHYIIHLNYDSATALQLAAYVSGEVYGVREKRLNVWGDWEHTNPPMELGIEYRTTERYLGKPVYVKLVDCGTIPAQGTHKDLVFSPDASSIVSVTAYSPQRGTTLPYYDANGVRYAITGTGGNSVMIWNYSESLMTTDVRALIKYTKTTD